MTNPNRPSIEKILKDLRSPDTLTMIELRELLRHAADRLEAIQAAYINMREFAEQSGLDTAARN